MLKTDYIKAFTKAIEEADLENENVARNLDNALVMASAKYEVNDCVNVEGLTSNGKWELTDPVFNFGINRYRLKPEPQYKPLRLSNIRKLYNEPIICKSDRVFYTIVGVVWQEFVGLPKQAVFAKIQNKETKEIRQVHVDELLRDYLFCAVNKLKPVGVEVTI